MNRVELEFLGAAGTVTGSRYLLTCGEKKVLIDCGLFQGLKLLRLKNWAEFPCDPREIDAIILTHAHIDHSGYIPRLVKEGFRGKVYATSATRELCQILLPDCGYLQEEEAAYLNRTGRTKHSPAMPLFTLKEAEASLQYFVEVPFNTLTKISSELAFEFHYSGHILGAASVRVHAADRKIAFTGDVGRQHDRLFFPPEPLQEADYLVTESTYGNRSHGEKDTLVELAEVVNQVHSRGGVLLVPAFAVGRAQTLMHFLATLRAKNLIPKMPMFLNSPMATDFSNVFRRHKELHKLTADECAQITSTMTFVRSPEESAALNEREGPMVIISASGMLTGGRVLHHLKAFAPFPENCILLTGFQAAGTRGEALQRGVRQIKVHGQYVQVNAEVRALENMSAHADQGEMVTWFKQSRLHPKQVFVTHGEATAADDFRRHLTEVFGWNCIVPEQLQRVVL